MSDARSVERLYRLHQRELMRFATTLVGESDAGDVVSDAMESLLKTGALHDAVHPSALMHRAVYAKAQSWHRSVFRRRSRERRFAESVIVSHPDLNPDVVRAVAALSQQQRACIYLTYWHDLLPNDVAAWLDIGEGSVKRHLARARANLREVLDE